MTRWRGIGLLVAFVVGCGESEPSDGSEHTVVDSAGIEIVPNQAPTWQSREGWTVSERPVRLGVTYVVRTRIERSGDDQ